MKQFLLILLLAFSTYSFGQVEVIDSNIVVEVLPDVNELKKDIRIVNTTGDVLEFYWDLNRENTPSEWQFKVCDTNLCYDWDLETCPCSQTNFFMPGDTAAMQIYIRPNGVEGVSDIHFRVLQACGRDSTYADWPVSYIVDSSVSTHFEEVENNQVLFPNPSSSFFKIKNDEEVADVMVYNIIGKKIFQEKHRPGRSHDVSNLNKGIYLVRLLDKSHNIIKVLRLNKD